MVVSRWETEPGDWKKPTGRSPQHDQRTPTDRPPARTRRDGGTTFHGYDHLRADVYHRQEVGSHTTFAGVKTEHLSKIHFCIFDGSAEQFRQQQCLATDRTPTGRYEVSVAEQGGKDERRTGDIARRGHEAARHVMTRCRLA
ncbi:hypothetical protein Bbelb_254760 [Branchiostoma belcheri]|nr:hypothetical protein Bbelb_254760 [Branchiostoma belcheri]